ncbi:MAG: hypothetical protein PHE73_09450 [Sulfurovaceae bacterium]|nr:hypothetical protein [Sulfurovaceae bacterium]
MKQKSSYKLTTQEQAQNQPQNQWADVLPAGLGIAGQISGGALGLLGGGAGGTLVEPGGGTVLGAIGGERFGQTAGGAVGQGAGEWLKEFLQGKKADPTAIASNVGQGALYAQIPGGKFAEGIVNPLLRAGAKVGGRFLGGAGVEAGTQAIRNVEKGKPIEQGLAEQGAVAGALNTILPGGAKLLGQAAKIPRFIAGKGQEMAESVLERQKMAPLRAAETQLGKGIIKTGEGTASIAPEAQALIDKYKIPMAPKGDIQQVKPALQKASADIEKQLKPLLDTTIVSYSTNVSPIVNNNLRKFFGTIQLRRLGGRTIVPSEVANFVKKTGNLGGKLGANVNLYKLKQFQREAGSLVKDWQSPKDTTDKFFIQTYFDIGKLIDSKLDSVAAPKYKDLIRQHKIIVNANDTFDALTKGKGKLPDESLSTRMGEEKQMRGLLSNERIMQIALGGSVGLTNLLPIPKEAKAGLSLAELLMLGPAAFPQAGPAVQKYTGGLANLMEAPANNATIMQLLQQLGVRIPSMGQ